MSHKHTKLILGTAQFGFHYGINNKLGKPHSEEIFKMLHMAGSHGIKRLDTAEAYGDSEKIIGRFISNHPEIPFKIITKYSFQNAGEVQLKIEKSMERLSVQSIDTVLFHSFDDYNDRSIVEALSAQKRHGLIDRIGVSVYDNNQAAYLIDKKDVDIVQLPFNLLDNHNLRANTIIALKEAGKEIHTRSVFLQGLFFMEPSSLPHLLLKLTPYLNELQKISSKSNISLTDLALNYVLSKEYIDHVLIGVDSAEQLLSNIISSDKSLSERTTQEIDSIHCSEIQLLNPSNWKK